MSHKTKKVCFATVLCAWFALSSSVSRAAETKNRLASNRLASNRLASNRLASNRLASNALSSTRLKANENTAQMLSTEDGRDVYSYIIGCALPDGMTIEATVPGAPDSSPPATNYTCSGGRCAFAGALGLAEYWIDHRLARSDQRWVSACLFARVNANSIAEAISLRGPHDSLTVGGDEAVLYNAQEGAFFGNIFSNTDGPIDWNACSGRDVSVATDQARDCAAPDPNDPTKTKCGFNYAGDCADYSPEFPNPYACKIYDPDAGIFEVCHAAPGNGRWRGLKKYREVITTYVAQ
jgi:hypothetical protein